MNPPRHAISALLALAMCLAGVAQTHYLAHAP